MIREARSARGLLPPTGVAPCMSNALATIPAVSRAKAVRPKRASCGVIGVADSIWTMMTHYSATAVNAALSLQDRRGRANSLDMPMKAELWIKAYLRTAIAGGAFATVAKRGDEERGAIFIKVSRLDGTADLYVPAPTGLLEQPRLERMWMMTLGPAASEGDVDQRLLRERSVDSDIWIVDIEDRQARHFLDDWLAAPQA